MNSMKDSNFKWIGEIPSNWKVLKVKNGFYRKKKKAYQKDPIILSLARSGVKIRDISNNEGQIAASYYEYNPVTYDDMLLNPMDLQSGANCSISNVEGVISPAYINLRYKKGFNPKFYDYYFKYQYWSFAFFTYGKGVSLDNRWTLNEDTLMNLPLVVPPLDEQKRIADFLDNKCEKIDSLRKDVENQIDILEKYKKSSIFEKVTNGIHSNTDMKDSSLKYIGYIPNHWKLDKLKYHLVRNEPKNPGNVPVLSLYREFGIIPKDSRDDNHNVTSEDTSKYKYVVPNDFVINKMKAWQGSVAVSQYEGIVSPAYYIYKFTDNVFNKSYFHYLLRSCYKDEFRRLSGGIREGQWDLPASALENSLILIPPLEEQKEIADYLDDKCKKIDSIINDKKAELDTLEKYKKSIIYEYVTGKKEVA